MSALLLVMKAPAVDFSYRGTVRRVVDGDTVDVELDVGLRITSHQRLRLFGIDAPEVRGPEREAGNAATEYLAGLIDNTDGSVWVRTLKDRRGKYGRYLAVLWPASGEGDSLNLQMINAGHATEWS